MAKITIQAADLITNSRADINANFTELYDNKEDVANKDTDTSLSSNSDTKYPSVKAVKAYVDAGGNVNASETTKGIVEEATDAEVTAGTDTGGTGAKLFVPPSKLNTRINSLASQIYSVGSLSNNVAKTYFNIQLPFTIATGSVAGALTTDFENWIRVDASKSVVYSGGAFVDFVSTGSETIYINWSNTTYKWNLTNIVILDFWAKLPASGTGDISMGFGADISSWNIAYNNNGATRIVFAQKSSGELYAVASYKSVGVTTNDISSGLTLTNWNNYRIELDLSNNALFYVNGVLKSTIATNISTENVMVAIGFGRSDTSLFKVTAPNLSLEMNP